MEIREILIALLRKHVGHPDPACRLNGWQVKFIGQLYSDVDDGRVQSPKQLALLKRIAFDRAGIDTDSCLT
jgi:hypothetical protein